MRLLSLALILLLLLDCCGILEAAATRFMMRKGGRLERVQEQALDKWGEAFPEGHALHRSHKKRRHRHKRRHHHKRHQEKEVADLLRDMDRIVRPRFG